MQHLRLQIERRRPIKKLRLVTMRFWDEPNNSLPIKIGQISSQKIHFGVSCNRKKCILIIDLK